MVIGCGSKQCAPDLARRSDIRRVSEPAAMQDPDWLIRAALIVMMISLATFVAIALSVLMR